MSEENVEVIREALEAFAAVDVERLLGYMDPEIEFEPHLAGVEGNYRGHGGVREFMSDAFPYSDGGQVVRIKWRDIRDLGDRILALGTFEINFRDSGIDLEVPFGIVATIRGGLIVHLKDFGNRTEALEAAGLRE
jgi:ketosteroid isomerase-like protein